MIVKPVRRIGVSNRSITGKHTSKKTGTVHQFESALERDHLVLLEFDDEVSHYVTQPVTIRYRVYKSTYRYTPDVIIYYRDASRPPMLCEVKYEAELLEKQDEYALKFNAAEDYAKENGYIFGTITEKEIRTPYLENLKLLSRYHHAPIDESYAGYIIHQLEHESFLEIETVAGKEKDRANILYTIFQMLAAKRLGCKMDTQITMNTLIWNQ